MNHSSTIESDALEANPRRIRALLAYYEDEDEADYDDEDDDGENEGEAEARHSRSARRAAGAGSFTVEWSSGW